MYIQPEEDKTFNIKDVQNVHQTMKNLRPKNTIVTRLSNTGEQWLKDNLDLDLSKELQEDANDRDLNLLPMNMIQISNYIL